MFKILLIILLIAIGIFFSFSWTVVYHLVKFGVNRRATKLITLFFISGSLAIIGFTLWALMNIVE